MKELVLVAVGGALGAVARYGVSLWALRRFGPDFPWGTLAVNLAGCLLLGLLTELAITNHWVPRPVALAVGTGFVGALTTFSTFGNETVRLAQASGLPSALANVAANVVLGLLFVGIGIAIARGLVAGFGGS